MLRWCFFRDPDHSTYEGESETKSSLASVSGYQSIIRLSLYDKVARKYNDLVKIKQVVAIQKIASDECC